MPSPHSFHIPVMGTAFTLDTPLRLAKFGITSTVSLGDDILIEDLRRHYSQKEALPYEPIGDKAEDARARRLTAYLDFLHDQVEKQSQTLQQSGFVQGSELTKYFELLPEGELKAQWRAMLDMPQGEERRKAEEALRAQARPGDIDVNIMTKVDRSKLPNGQELPKDSSDALSGLRGFAMSKLSSSVVFSAGLNPRLYGYLTHFKDFFPDALGRLKKKVTLKVSDFRSADVQGRFLAKKGIWVSEFRVESGLNCGGHAFPPQGRLLGPILEEFRKNWEALREELYCIWSKALHAMEERPGIVPPDPPATRFSVQGGVGNWDEHQLLLSRFNADSVGWATPWLLVPEATLVDDDTRRKLIEADEDDVELSRASPLGIPFWNLKTSVSEEVRRARIAEGKPGSPCPHAYLIFNTEFGDKPLCTASRAYQMRKLKEIDASGLVGAALKAAKEEIVSRACICVDLGSAAMKALGLDSKAMPAVCPGPNIVWFTREASLEEMVGHIYGRLNLISRPGRPHQLLAELFLTFEYLVKELSREALGLSKRGADYFREYVQNMLAGMEYYADRSREFFGKSRQELEGALEHIKAELEALLKDPVPAASAA